MALKEGRREVNPPTVPSRITSRVELQILHVTSCPNVASLRELVEEIVADLDVEARIEEVEGDYPSPTLLIDGVQVIPGHTLGTASCRLDVPTREQIVAALGRQPEREPTDSKGAHGHPPEKL